MVSFYWALTTMTTIGYGDIVPHTNEERVLVMISMVVGALVFAYGLTNMCTLVFNFNKGQVQFNNKTDDLKDLLDEKNINNFLKKRVATYMFYSYFSSKADILRDNNVMNYLSTHLKEEIIYEATRKSFDGIVLLNQFGSTFLRLLSKHIKATIYPPDEIIIKPNSYINHIYVIGHGSVFYLNHLKQQDIGDLDTSWLVLQRQLQLRNLYFHQKKGIKYQISKFKKIQQEQVHHALDVFKTTAKAGAALTASPAGETSRRKCSSTNGRSFFRTM